MAKIDGTATVKCLVVLNPNYKAIVKVRDNVKEFYNSWEAVEHFRNTKPLSIDINTRGLTLAQSIDKHLPNTVIRVLPDGPMEKEFREKGALK